MHSVQQSAIEYRIKIFTTLQVAFKMNRGSGAMLTNRGLNVPSILDAQRLDLLLLRSNVFIMLISGVLCEAAK
jgi:hypothetical protein